MPELLGWAGRDVGAQQWHAAAMGPIQYAKNGDVHLAYRVVGEGDLDIVWVPGWVWDIEMAWEVPGIGGFLKELASLGRLIMFDKRGTGQSDPVVAGRYPTFDERVDDVLAVMDAAGSEQAALVGFSEGGTQALLTAVRAPERVSSVVSIGGWARLLAASDPPDLGISQVELDAFLDKAVANWGTGKDVRVVAPSRLDDPLFIERWAAYERRAASPSAVIAYGEMLRDVDIRDELEQIGVPTLLLHARGDRMVSFEQSVYLEQRLPDARLVELPGNDHLPFISHPEIVVEEIERHLLGKVRAQPAARQFAAVLFTDIVGSTDRASAVGDRSWRTLLDDYEALVERAVEAHSGRVVKSTGDGSLATFSEPQAAVLTAHTLHRDVARLGVELRAGIHCGQLEVRGEDVGGIGVHIAARVMGLAPPGGTLVSSTVRDILLGSGFAFAPHGTHELKGVPGQWQLYALERA